MSGDLYFQISAQKFPVKTLNANASQGHIVLVVITLAVQYHFSRSNTVLDRS